MDEAEIESRRSATAWLTQLLRWAWSSIRLLFLALLVAWTVLAVYYSNLPWAWLRIVSALGVAALSIWAVWLTRRPHMRWAFAVLFLVVLVWFAAIPASHDRPWRREVAVMPRAIIDGDRVRLVGVRNFSYRSETDFDESWEQREVSLAHLTSVDLFISFWKPGPIAHTFVSFNFDNAPPVCISIEIRPEKGERFGLINTQFKQFELIYLVGEERDLVGVRVNHRNEQVYMYRLRAPPEFARRLFLVYLERINELAERPEWYHLLKNNCTVNIVRYANAAGREGRWDFRHLLNGWIDSYLYQAGHIDTTLPFAELREASRINAAARSSVDNPDFSARIRQSLPTNGR